MSEPEKLTKSKDVIAYLAEQFPNCFSLKGDAKPLKIGIFEDLAKRLEDDEKVSKTRLRTALRHYTNSWRYLYSIKAGEARVDQHVEHQRVRGELRVRAEEVGVELKAAVGAEVAAGVAVVRCDGATARRREGRALLAVEPILGRRQRRGQFLVGAAARPEVDLARV